MSRAPRVKPAAARKVKAEKFEPVRVMNDFERELLYEFRKLGKRQAEALVIVAQLMPRKSA